MGDLAGLDNGPRSKHVAFGTGSGWIEQKNFCVQKFIVFINI